MMNMRGEGDSESERYKLIFNERMNMRDEGDSGSEHLDSTAVVFLFPTHYSTISHERDVIYLFWILKH